MFDQALNEEKGIEDALRYLESCRPPPHEIVVVDGGSRDRWAHRQCT